MKRKEITHGDFATMDFETRKNILKGQFYLTETDLAGTACIFVDDAIMFGTHYAETYEVLSNMGAKGIYGFFALEASSALLSKNDKVEHLLNNRFEVTLAGLQRLINKAEFGITVRMLKLILKQPDETLMALMEWMEVVRPDIATLMCFA